MLVQYVLLQGLVLAFDFRPIENQKSKIKNSITCFCHEFACPNILTTRHLVSATSSNPGVTV
jgi:hypothetical protein